MAPKRSVYVLASQLHEGRFYVGLTSNVDHRLAAHNAGASVHTAKHRPWRIVVAVNFADEASAFAFERYLKTGSGRAFAKRHFS